MTSKNRKSNVTLSDETQHQPVPYECGGLALVMAVQSFAKRLEDATWLVEHREWVNSRHEALRKSARGATQEDLRWLHAELRTRWDILRKRTLEGGEDSHWDDNGFDHPEFNSALDGMSHWLMLAADDLSIALNFLMARDLDGAWGYLIAHEANMVRARSAGDSIQYYWRSCPIPVEPDEPEGE
jgi:hypothetical protein